MSSSGCSWPDPATWSPRRRRLLVVVILYLVLLAYVPLLAMLGVAPEVMIATSTPVIAVTAEICRRAAARSAAAGVPDPASV